MCGEGYNKISNDKDNSDGGGDSGDESSEVAKTDNKDEEEMNPQGHHLIGHHGWSESDKISILIVIQGYREAKKAKHCSYKVCSILYIY